MRARATGMQYGCGSQAAHVQSKQASSVMQACPEHASPARETNPVCSRTCRVAGGHQQGHGMHAGAVPCQVEPIRCTAAGVDEGGS